MRKFPFTEEQFKAIYSTVPRLCADAVIIHPKGIVLVQRSHEAWEGMWHTPGVTVYQYEPIIEAVKRASVEEIGIQVTIEKYLTHMEFHSEEKQRGFGYSVSMAYLCTTAEELPTSNQDGEEIKAWTELPERIIEEQQEVFLVGLTEWRKRFGK